jgi:hypothetical protein
LRLGSLRRTTVVRPRNGGATDICTHPLFPAIPFSRPELVPDQDHALITEGWGKFGDFSYASAARTPDGKLAIIYIPDRRTIMVDLSKLAGPATARWYDPANGTFHEIAGSPFSNAGSHAFATPGNNADGEGNADWVLVLEGK